MIEDMDEARRSTGTAADFSKWNLGGNFKKMKISSKEEVKEPIEEDDDKQAELPFENEKPIGMSISINSPPEIKELAKPIGMSISINSLPEIKELAKSLLPKVTEIEPSSEKYNLVCELAINYAFAFESMWKQKINIGGNE